jgi:hypothetical protein
MRKWLWIGSITVALGGIGGYLYFAEPAPRPFVDRLTKLNLPPKLVDDGAGEASDAVEPIFVDHAPPARPMAPVQDDGPMARVVLPPGMTQPPRPDAEAGHAPRMPYADEDH